MRRMILLVFILLSFIAKPQDFYSNGDCKAAFSYKINYEVNTFAPATVLNFYDLSSGKVKEWYWDFGNGETSREQNPMHIFNHPIGGPNVKINPYRTVRLTILTDSCKSTVTQTINILNPGDTVQQNCRVAFGFDRKERTDSAASFAVIQFYSKSDPPATEWYWSFDDGTTSNEPNPVHTFQKISSTDPSGSNPFRNVCLTIKTAEGCKISTCEKIQVFVITQPLPEPARCASIFKFYEMERDSSSKSAVFQFNNYSEGDGLKYLWHFGDGTESTEKEPVKKFSFAQREYKVCLTVKSTNGCNDMLCKTVYLEPPIINDTTVIQPCFTDFGYKVNDILMGPLPSALVNFYSKSYPEAREWFWDFGDGTTSNEPNPTHLYVKTLNDGAAGVDLVNGTETVDYPYYTVCLTVITVNGCKTSLRQNIPVFSNVPYPSGCKVYFKYNKPDNMISIPEVVPVKLTDVSEGKIISRLWKFEDGTTSTEKELIKTFSIFKPVHKVCLTVMFADSCVNTYCDAVYVNSSIKDTIPVNPDCPYKIKIDGGFPPALSSCAGWASVRVYLADSLVVPVQYSWSTGETSQKIDKLCPARTYAVKVQMADDCVVSKEFILNADGAINPYPPINWWLSGSREKFYVRSDTPGGMKVEWKLCDGTIVTADSIPLDAINCGGSGLNMIVKDSLGNIVHTENISLKGSITGLDEMVQKPEIQLWPNPVSDRLNISYSGDFQSKLKVEILEITGRLVLDESFSGVYNGRELNINTEILKQGIYICRISAGDKMLVAKKISRK